MYSYLKYKLDVAKLTGHVTQLGMIRSILFSIRRFEEDRRIDVNGLVITMLVNVSGEITKRTRIVRRSNGATMMNLKELTNRSAII
jgi:hypothetical protein